MIRYKTRPSAPFIDQSWKQIQEKIESIAHGLKALGVKPGQNVGLLSVTCHHWMPCDFGIMSAGAVTVPIYHSSTSDSVSYIVNHAELEVVFVRNKIQLQKLRGMWDDLPNLKYLIVMLDKGDIPKNNPKILTLEGLCKIGLEELEKDPEGIKDAIKDISLDDTASIIYTSGTTGTPKGVVLSHRNFLVAALSFYQSVPFEENFTLLSFLPLAHIFERVASEIYGIDQGVTFTYCEKVEHLPSMLIETCCDMMPVVPRILEKIYERVMSQVSKKSAFEQKLFFAAVETGKEYIQKKIAKETIGWDLKLKYQLAFNTVLKKIRQRIAPNLKIFVVGGAPFSKELAYFYLALGFDVVEGYGLTESSAAITVNPPWANKPGTVGLPFKHFEIKIAEDGEVICKGDSVFQEYYKNPEATRETLIDGWLHTGDLGEFDEDGYLKITGRKKDLIITAGGKNISPARIEDELLRSKYLNQVIALGDREKYISALIVPNKELLMDYAKAHKIEIPAGTLINDVPGLRELITKEIAHYSQDLGGYEQIKNFHLLENELSIESGELTPTLKVKRNVVREKYKDIIQPLFGR